MSQLLIAANIIGYIGAGILWFQVVFGSRHIFKYITHDTVAINKIHKQLGIYGTLLIFAHPLLEMMYRLESFFWIFIPDFSMQSARQITYGKIALVLLIIIWVTSALVREKIKWKPWKYLHLLSYPLVIVVFIHMNYIGTFFERYLLIKAIWFAMLLVFFIVCVARVLAYAGVLKNSSQIVSLEMVGDSILLITCKPETPITPRIGQHIYIQTGRFKSEHPFTVMENHADSGTFTLGIRKLGGLWDELMAKNIGDTILVDGPYGVFTEEAQNTQPKVLISGGIGVTPFIDLVKKYGENTTYINCNRQVEDIVYRTLLKEKVTHYIDVIDTYTGEPDTTIFVGRISSKIITTVVGESVTNVPYFICGSPMFIASVRNILLTMGVKKSSIFFEELGF